MNNSKTTIKTYRPNPEIKNLLAKEPLDFTKKYIDNPKNKI